MDWILEHCGSLRSKLQIVIDGNTSGDDRGFKNMDKKMGLKVPWSWVCRSVIETVRRYPSGLTEAVVLAELELLWRRDVRGAFVPGKLRAYLDAQYAPLSEVIQAGVVRHADQLVTLAEDSSSKAPFGSSPALAHMYLHQNFKSCRRFVEQAGHDLLTSGRKLRLTGVRMLTGAPVGPGNHGRGRPTTGTRESTLLLTEYLAFVLDNQKSEDLRLASNVFGRMRVRDTFDEAANGSPYVVVCKVAEIRRPRQHQDRSAGIAGKKRLMAQTIVLQCAAQGSKESDKRAGASSGEHRGEGGGVVADHDKDMVLLHLWDEQMCLSALFRKGDGLAIYWPWVVRSSDREGAGAREEASQAGAFASQVMPTPLGSGWHYEYGSATTLFVLPRDCRGPLLAAANGRADWAAAPLASSPLQASASVAFGEQSRNGTKGVMKDLRARDVAADEFGIRDLLQVVHVSVDGVCLPQILPARPQFASQSQHQARLSQAQSKPLLSGTHTDTSYTDGVQVVELSIRDESGETEILCSGVEAVQDALRCRPGHLVLACGLRTFERVAPTRNQGRCNNVVVLCGDREQTRGGAAMSTDTAGMDASGVAAAGGHGVEGASRILQSSCLEGLLHCPFLSRHTMLSAQHRSKQAGTFVCKGAVTWARWEFAGDGLWTVHRRCRTRLPCHYNALSTGTSSPKLAGQKRWRDMHKPGASRAAASRDARVACPFCKCAVNLASANEAELAYAPLLLAIDDGSRCILAECRGEVVAAAFGGIHAQVFVHMDNVERNSTVGALTGREIRCIIGSNHSGIGNAGKEDWKGCTRNSNQGAVDDESWSGEVQYRVERLAAANPAADLAHILSFTGK